MFLPQSQTEWSQIEKTKVPVKLALECESEYLKVQPRKKAKTDDGDASTEEEIDPIKEYYDPQKQANKDVSSHFVFVFEA